MIIAKSDIWDSIIENRSKFYTKNLNAFVGYARKQAAKYSCRGSRLNTAERVLNYLSTYDQLDRMSYCWDDLPKDEHCYFLEPNKDGVRQYQVCGKIIQETAGIGYTKQILQKFYDNYGQRAKLAAEGHGIDHKAVSHALRAAVQVKQLLTENTIVFPLKEASFLKDVKDGKLNYMNEVAPKLEDLMDEIEILSKNSDLPEKADRKFWDSFIIEVLEKEFF